MRYLMNIIIICIFCFGLMAEEVDLKFVFDVLMELEDDFNIVV